LRNPALLSTIPGRLIEFYEYLLLENQLVTGQILVVPQCYRVLRFYSWFTVYRCWS